jgi:hypothetical protein
MILKLIKAAHKALPLKAKRRLNKHLVTFHLRSAPKPRAKVRKPRKSVAVAQTSPVEQPSNTAS